MSSSEYSDSDAVEAEEDPSSPDIRVCLRLRPMNKFETSRRSKNCVEVHDFEKTVTIDSPLEGEFDFGFNRVFDEYASQIEVFEYTVYPVVTKLLEGYNCTVMAYGQTGTGKTHTMMGVGGGTCRLPDKSTRGADPENQGSGASSANGSLEDGPETGMDAKVDIEGQGMIPRTISAIFAQMKKSSPEIEYTIRCSYVEIYLEKLLDLLNPHGAGDVALNIVDDGFADEAGGAGTHSEGSRIVGASELCCIDEADVFSLLDRGNACRTVSSTKMNTDSNRSNAIFIIKIEQRNAESGEIKKSVLHMVDLAGSEMASKASQYAAAPQSQENAVQSEAKMINKSLSALTNVVRAKMKRQKGANVPYPSSSRLYKLTRLLRPCFGGNGFTTIILTASPSSYNIGETISAIRFGQCCKRIKNNAVVNTEFSPEHYKKQLAQTEKKQSELKILVKALAAECQSLKTEGTKGAINEDIHSGPLWDSIEEVLSEEDDNDSDYVVVVKRGGSDDCGERETNPDLDSRSHDNAENTIAELQSEVAVLRTQNENLSIESKKAVQDLIDAKNEIQVISQRKIEVEHNLRTSQFRENEATVFLRQFRRFYRRLLRNKAAQGTGSTQEITTKTPGVPDLNDLIDVDTLLVESGLIEEDEMHDETTAGTYRPSGAALLRSTAAAKKASKQGVTLERDASVSAFSVSVHSETSEDDTSSANESVSRVGAPDTASAAHSLDKISEIGDGGASQNAGDSAVGRNEKENGGGADAGAGAGASAEVGDPLDGCESIRSYSQTISGASIADRQRVLRTPAGRLLAAKEKELERDFLKMTERCIELQMALDEEKANNDALANRSGTFGKKREAQEAITLRQQLDRKTHDLQAIIWKMNELHLINKTYNDKMANREQHVSYLEENLADLQNTNKRLMQEMQESEKKLREELESLRVLVDGVTVPLWQFGEQGAAERTLASRIIVPAIVGERKIDLDRDMPTRRLSEGALEPSLDSGGEEMEGIESVSDEDEGTDGQHNRELGDGGGGFATDLPIKTVESAEAATQTEDTEESPVQTSVVAVETATAQTQTAVMETTETSIQTDALPDPQSARFNATVDDAAFGVDGRERDIRVQDVGERDPDSQNLGLAAGIAAGVGAMAIGLQACDESDGAKNEVLQSQSRAVGPSASREGAPLSNGTDTYGKKQNVEAVEDSFNEDTSQSVSADDTSHDSGHSSSEEESVNQEDGFNGNGYGSQEDRQKRLSFTGRELVVDPNQGEYQPRTDGEIGLGATPSDDLDSLFSGGKRADFTPRELVEKLGPKVRAGVLRDCRKKPNERRHRKKSGNTEGRRRKKKSSREGSRTSRSSSQNQQRAPRPGGGAKRSKSAHFSGDAGS